MALDEAIKHLEETLSDKSHKWSCESCKQEHKQLLAWLKELKALKEINGDLISRDALKNALHFVYSCAYIEGKSKEGIVSDIIEEIDNAPAVEAVEFEYHDKLIKQAYQKGKDIRPEGKWIPVSERLPDIDGYYLVSFEDEQILVAHSSSIIKNHDFEPKMLAWQVLPEPYKKGGAE